MIEIQISTEMVNLRIIVAPWVDYIRAQFSGVWHTDIAVTLLSCLESVDKWIVYK